MQLKFKEQLDNIFWDLSENSFVYKFIKVLEDFYSEIGTEFEDFYKNLFLLDAKNLFLFSKIFPIQNRTVYFAPPFLNEFEYFRIKVISVWMATITAPTAEMLNWLAGGYTLQPCFINLSSENLNQNWILNQSYLDGDIINPNIYNEPRTWLRSIYSFITTVNITLFSDGSGINQLQNNEEFAEFKKQVLRMYGPWRVYFNLLPYRESPPDFYLWSSNFGDIGQPNGYGNFDLSSFSGLIKEKEYYIIDPNADISQPIGFETVDRPIQAGEYEFNCFELLLSDRIERIFYYSLDSGANWIKIEPLDKFQVLVNGNIRFKMVINYVEDRRLYRFISMMLRR